MQKVVEHGSSEARYTLVAIALHWAIAVFIIFNLAVGYFMNGMPKPIHYAILPIHVSGGITVLVLSLFRVVWRLTHKPPAFPSTMPSVERMAAHTVHFVLYVLMIAMPLIGWMILSSHPPHQGPDAFPIWGVFQLHPIAPLASMALEPGGIARQKAWHTTFVTMHSTGGWIMIALLCLHVGGALKHQFWDRQAELARMGVGGFPRSPGAPKLAGAKRSPWA